MLTPPRLVFLPFRLLTTSHVTVCQENRCCCCCCCCRRLFLALYSLSVTWYKDNMLKGRKRREEDKPRTPLFVPVPLLWSQHGVCCTTRLTTSCIRRISQHSYKIKYKQRIFMNLTFRQEPIHRLLVSYAIQHAFSKVILL